MKLCKLGEFPLGVEVCYCFRSVRGGSEHMSVVITFLNFHNKKIRKSGRPLLCIIPSLGEICDGTSPEVLNCEKLLAPCNLLCVKTQKK